MFILSSFTQLDCSWSVSISVCLDCCALSWIFGDFSSISLVLAHFSTISASPAFWRSQISLNRTQLSVKIAWFVSADRNFFEPLKVISSIPFYRRISCRCSLNGLCGYRRKNTCIRYKPLLYIRGLCYCVCSRAYHSYKEQIYETEQWALYIFNRKEATTLIFFTYYIVPKLALPLMLFLSIFELLSVHSTRLHRHKFSTPSDFGRIQFLRWVNMKLLRTKYVQNSACCNEDFWHS